MRLFTGEYRHQFDNKNRLMIPSKYRVQLGTKVFITEWLDGCLAAFAQEEWEELIKKLNALPMTNAKARAFVRRISGKADECIIDKQGRILLPQFQLNDENFLRTCVIVGVSNHFEIWPEEKYDLYSDEKNADFENFAEDLTELLK